MGEISSTRIQDITRKLISSFRHGGNKEKIVGITGGDEKSLDNLVKAAAARILVEDYQISYPGDSDESKERSIYRELKTLFGDTITDGLRVKDNVMNFYNNLFDLLLKTPSIKYKEKEAWIIDQFEDDLIEIFRLFPEFYFFDFLEDLVKIRDLVESKAGGDLSEELFSFNIFRRKIIDFLQVNKLKDLELLYFPIKKLTERIYEQSINRMPTSKRGMDAFSRANELKNSIIGIFKESNEAKESLEQIEEKVKVRIDEGLREEAESSPNQVIYFLQFLLDMDFSELIKLLRVNGIDDILLFSSALTIDYNLIEYKLDEKGIDLPKIKSLQQFDGNLVGFVNVSLNDFKRELRMRDVDEDEIAKYTVQSIIKNHLSEIESAPLEFIAADLAMDQDDLVDMLLLEVTVKELLKSLNIRSMDQLLMVLKMQEFIQNVTNEIFLSILGDLTKQIARIIEFFLLLGKIKADMIRNIDEFREKIDMKAWNFVQAQDKLIVQLMQLQENVAYILNKDDPVEVNAFILGKLCNKTFDDALKDLKEGNSMIYFDAVEHAIDLSNLDAVARISALDLLFRFQELQMK
ncbi:MAG: hypothetical protein ACTSUE_21145 [Promethearchaeota archaeon]